MPALLRGMAPLIPMVAGRGVKSNKGQPLQTYGQTATIEFAHFHSSQRGGHSSQRACKDKIYVILYLDLQRPNYICVPNLKVDQGRVRVRVRVRVVRVRELASRHGLLVGDLALHWLLAAARYTSSAKRS